MEVLEYVKKDKTRKYNSLPWRISIFLLFVSLNTILPQLEGTAKLIFACSVCAFALWFLIDDRYLKVEEYVALRVSVEGECLVFYRRHQEVFRASLSEVKEIYNEWSFLVSRRLVVKLNTYNEHVFSVPLFSSKKVDNLSDLKKILGIHHTANVTS